MLHAVTSKVKNSAQGLSCKLKFVHDTLHKIQNVTNFLLANKEYSVIWTCLSGVIIKVLYVPKEA
jgi:hypothetical protein